MVEILNHVLVQVMDAATGDGVVADVFAGAVSELYEPAAGFVLAASAIAGKGYLYTAATGSFSAPAAPAPTADALKDYAGRVQDTVLAGVFSFNVAASGQPAHIVTTKLDQAGQFAMLKVQGWLQLNASNAGASMPYSNVDFTATTLTVAEADSLVEQAAALDTQSYGLLNQVAAGITASPPTITTTAQIDAAFAALAPAAASTSPASTSSTATSSTATSSTAAPAASAS